MQPLAILQGVRVFVRFVMSSWLEGNEDRGARRVCEPQVAWRLLAAVCPGMTRWGQGGLGSRRSGVPGCFLPSFQSETSFQGTWLRPAGLPLMLMASQ